MSTFSGWWWFVGIVACTPLTAAGKRVRVVEDPRKVQGCEFLANVEGSGRNSKPGERIGGNALIAETSAENDARNKAAELGADTLLQLETEQGYWSAQARGGAYRCGSATGSDESPSGFDEVEQDW